MRFIGVQWPSWSLEKKSAVGIHRDPVGRSKTAGKYLRLGAVPADPDERAMLRHDGRQRVTGAFGVVEVAGGVGLQVHGEFVEMLGHLRVVVEVLVEVGFAIAVKIDKAGDLIAAKHVDLLIDDLQSQRLKQSTGDAAPSELAESLAEPLDNPNVALPRTYGGATSVAEEVEPA